MQWAAAAAALPCACMHACMPRTWRTRSPPVPPPRVAAACPHVPTWRRRYPPAWPRYAAQ
eukprot:364003-Chlamydomonas_euryale.AAC.24